MKLVKLKPARGVFSILGLIAIVIAAGMAVAAVASILLAAATSLFVAGLACFAIDYMVHGG